MHVLAMLEPRLQAILTSSVGNVFFVGASVPPIKYSPPLGCAGLTHTHHPLLICFPIVLPLLPSPLLPYCISRRNTDTHDSCWVFPALSPSQNEHCSPHHSRLPSFPARGGKQAPPSLPRSLSPVPLEGWGEGWISFSHRHSECWWVEKVVKSSSLLESRSCATGHYQIIKTGITLIGCTDSFVDMLYVVHI